MVDYEILAAMGEMFGRKLKKELQLINDRLDGINERVLKTEADMKRVKVLEVDDDVFYKQNLLKQCFADLTAEYLEQKKEITRMMISVSMIKDLVRLIGTKKGNAVSEERD